MIDYRVQ